MEKQEILSKLQQEYDYFSARKSEYDEMSDKEDQIKILQYRQTEINGMTLFTKILLGFGIFFALIYMVNILESVLSYIPIIGKLLLPVWSLVGEVISIGAAIFLPNKIDSLRSKRKFNKIQSQINDIDKGRDVICQELYSYYSQYENLPCLVPFDYSGPNVITKLSSYIQLGRADTMKEALNLLSTDAQHSEMIGTQRSIFSITQDVRKEVTRAANNIR